MSDIKRPAIPATSGVKDFDSLRRFLEPVKQLLEIHEGWRGRPGEDRFVPEWELDSIFNRVASMDVSAFVGNDTDPPDPPTAMLVTANVWGNLITWTNPNNTDLSHIEIWINTLDSVTEATLVGVVTVPRSEIGGPGQYLHFPSNLNDDHYYWIRAVDWSGNYSTWVPTEAMGGFLAPAQDTVGQTIDQVMEILQGSQPVYSAFDPATAYTAGNRVTDGGRTWQCYAPVTGVAPTDATGSSYWFRVGILIEGDVDGIPTVGIDGNAVVDGSLLARSIKTDELIAGGNVQIADGSIYIAGLAAETGNWIQGVEDLADYAYDLADTAWDLADDKIKVFRQSSIPTSISAGDLWVDTDDGNKLYRAGIKGANEIKAGEWVAVQDAGATYALLGLNSSGLITQWVRGNIFPTSGAAAPGSAGLWMTNSHLGYYNGSSWPVYIKNDGSFWFGKDSSNYFAYTTIGSSLVFSSNQSGAFWMLEGADINMQSTSSNPSMIKWYGAGYDIYMGRYPSNSALIFQPETEFYGGFVVGGVVSSGATKYFYRAITNALQHEINTSDLTKTQTGQIYFRYDSLRIKTPYIRPDGTVDLGSSTYKFRDLYLSGDISCDDISCGDLTPSGTVADFSMDSTAVITGSSTLDIDAGGYFVRFYSGGMRPELDGDASSGQNCGHPDYLWKGVYAYGFYEYGGSYNDAWVNPETGEMETVDDLAVIKALGTTGEYDAVTGQLKIDHATAHPILFARHGRDCVEWDDNGKVLYSARKGSVVRNHDGKPLYNLSTRVGLAFGAIRQLDTKIENILQVLRDNNLVADTGGIKQPA